MTNTEARTAADDIPAADIMRFALNIGQADLVFEAADCQFDGDWPATRRLHARLTAAFTTGHLTVTPEGIVELTAKGDAYLAAHPGKVLVAA